MKNWKTKLSDFLFLLPGSLIYQMCIRDRSGAFGLNKFAFTIATGDTPQSEWNVYVDPEAADIVYRCLLYTSRCV